MGPLRLERAHLQTLRRRYETSGLGGRVGFGQSPALVIVDLIYAFTDPGCPLGSPLDDVVDATGRLLDAAHDAGIAVVLTTISYHADMTDAGVWPAKIPSQRLLTRHSPLTQLDERLKVEPTDRVLVKKHASAFLGTTLGRSLRRSGIDTVVIAGATTSGCVRATAVDACGWAFRTLVVREAVGDRDLLVHDVSLFDLDTKYADVIGIEECINAFAAYRGAVS